MTSRKPSVVSRPTVAPVRSITVLVTSVVPCTMLCTSAALRPASFRIRSTPLTIASLGSSGVVSSLPVCTILRSASCSTRSVKVPPTSTPTRTVRSVIASLHAVILARRGGRDVAVAHVAPDRLRVARFRIAEAAAAGINHAQTRARRDGGARLRMGPRAVAELDQRRRAVAAAEHAQRRMIPAVGDQRQPHRRGRPELDLRLLAEPAAEAPGPAGIRGELLLPDDERCHALERFDRAGAHVGRERRGRQAVAVRGGAHAAGREQDLTEAVTVAVEPTEQR